jgi:hypothetical protein
LTLWGLSISTESGAVFLFNGEIVQPSMKNENHKVRVRVGM